MSKILSLFFTVVLAASVSLNLDTIDKTDIYYQAGDDINIVAEQTFKVDEADATEPDDNNSKYHYELQNVKDGDNYTVTYGDKTVKLHVDSTAPKITANKNSGTYTEAEVTFTVEGASKIESMLKKNDAEIGSLTFTDNKATVNLTEDGEYVVTVSAEDEAGNKSSESFSYKIYNPVEINASLENGTYNGANVTFTVKNATSVSGILKKNGTKISDLVFENDQAAIELTEKGTYVVEITANDSNGQPTTKSFNYTIHNDAPIITFDGLDNTIQNSNYSIKIHFTSEIPFLLKEATLDGNSVLNVDNPIVVSEEGEHTLVVRAKDIANNETTVTKTFTIDKNAPTVEIETTVGGQAVDVSALNNSVVNKDVAYTVTGTDNLAVTLNAQEVEASGTISNDGQYTLVAIAKDEAGNETKKTVSFTLDKTPPVINISGISSISNTPVNYTITTDGDITAVFTGKQVVGNEVVDVNDTKHGVNTLSGTLQNNGTYTLTVNAVDKAGNNAEQKVVTFTIDKNAPTLTIEGVEDGAFYKSKTVNYRVSGVDTSSTTGAETILTPEVTIDGKDVEPSGSAELSEGVHTIKAKIVDEAGNKVERSISFEIDVTAPKVSFNDETCVNDLKKVSADTSDKNLTSIVLKAYCKGKEETNGNPKYTNIESRGPVSLKYDDNDSASNDKWVFTATATDKAGNQTVVTKEITRDTVAPKISLNKPERYVNKDVVIDASSTDPNPGKTRLYVSKDGGEDTERDLKTTLSSEGDYVVTVKAVDAAGNKSEDSTKFTIDKTPPKVSLDAPEGHHKSVSKVSASSNEPGKVYMTVVCDGKTVFDENNDKNITCTKLGKDGEYTVTTYAIDLAGNKSETKKEEFVVDSTAPTVALSGIKEGAFSNKPVTITAEVNERFFKTNNVSFTYNGTKIPFESTSVNSKVSKTFNKDGIYEIKLSATDKAGNSSATKTLKFTIDTKKPEITISVPDQGTYDTLIAPKVTIKDEYFKSKDISLSKAVAFKDSFNDKGGTRTYVDIPRFKENDGVYNLNVRATDEAGNVATATKTFIVNRFGSTFKVKQKPSKYGKVPDSDVVITETNVSGIESYKIKISRDAESFEAEGVKVETDGDTTTYTIPKSNFEKDGVYKVTITTKDKAGNTSKSKSDFNFVIDNAEPVITYTGVEANTTYKESSVKMYVQATDTLTENSEISVFAGGKELKVKEDENGQYVEIPFGYNQDIKITATDKAGNTATTEIKNVSVSTSKFAGILSHKKLAGGIFAGVVAAAAGLIALLTRRKKDSSDGDDMVI